MASWLAWVWVWVWVWAWVWVWVWLARGAMLAVCLVGCCFDVMTRVMGVCYHGWHGCGCGSRAVRVLVILGVGVFALVLAPLLLPSCSLTLYSRSLSAPTLNPKQKP